MWWISLTLTTRFSKERQNDGKFISWARCVSYCTESSIYTYHIMYATTEGNSPNFKLSSKSRQSAYRFRFQIHTMKHAILRIILTIQAKILCRLTADMQSPRNEDRLVLGVIALSSHCNRVIRHARLALAITRVNMQSYKQTAGLPFQRLAFQRSHRLADGIVLDSWTNYITDRQILAKPFLWILRLLCAYFSMSPSDRMVGPLLLSPSCKEHSRLI